MFLKFCEIINEKDDIIIVIFMKGMKMDSELTRAMEKAEQETGIKQLNLKQVKHPVYSKTTQVVDGQTGEAVETVGTKVYKIQSRVEFLQLYTDNLNILYRLDGQAAKVLLFIFQNMTFMNTVALNSTLRKNVSIGLKISLPTVSRALSKLIEKGILKPIISQKLRDEYKAYTDDIFLVDPNIVGKGPFKELEKLRWTMTKEYDLVKMEGKTTVNIEHAYADYDEVSKNLDKHKVIDVETNQIDKNTRETNILIANKENNDDENNGVIDISPLPQNDSLFDSKELDNNDENEINLALELENRKIEALQLKLKDSNLEIIKKLIDAGKVNEALEFQKNMDK